jgi:probable F420-dependent oxidoreductase
MTHPFRFGLQVSSLPPQEWRETARRIEALGYSTLFLPDHFRIQWEPATALAAVAGATERLRVGALVYDIDYRHPVIYAKAAATLHIMSGGRHEFGIGAGWMETDYVEAGLPYDRAGVRIERLEEALQIILSMWSEERTSFEGRHYTIREIAQAAELPENDRPRVLIGGGGKKLLTIAGRYADIAGINPKVPEGKITADTPRDLAPERVREKVGWVRAGAEGAGRNPEEIEFSSLTFITAITDDPKSVREGLASNTGMTEEQVADCPLFLTGPASEIRDQLERRREETGISYVVIQSADVDMALIEAFAKEVVEPLAGR